MFAQALVLFLLSGFWFLTTVNSAIDEFSPPEKGLIFALVGAVLFIQALVLLAAARIKPPLDKVLGASFIGAAGLAALFAVARADWVWIVLVGGACAVVAGMLALPRARRFILRCESLAAFFAVVNLYSLNLSFSFDFAFLDFGVQVPLLAAAWFLGCLGFGALREAGARKYAVAAAAFLFLHQAAVFTQQSFFAPEPDAELPPKAAQTSSENIRIVDFEKTPNVYFIMFETLLPPPVLQRDLRLHATYDDALRELGFRRFKNAFSDGASTKDSVNRLLAMDGDYFRGLSARGLQYQIFSGRAPSPLYEIFQANGYRINVYNRDFLLGGVKGRFIDNYWLPSFSAMCASLRVYTSLYAGFFGYCPLTDKLLAAGVYQTDFVDLYIDDFAIKSAGGTPQFFFARVKSADHVPPGYRRTPAHFASFRNRYDMFKDLTKDAAGRIARHVRKNDPDALMFFFGDHGPALAFGWHYKEWQEMTTMSGRQFYARDRSGVYAAVWPADACRDYFQPAPGGFFTTAMIARQIVRCLADGDDPANETITYPLRPVKGKEPDSYRDYLYEEN